MVTFARSESARFVAVGHRGAPRDLPSNTMAGFRRAHALGCPMVECDVRWSRDGVLVLAHDEHVVDGQSVRYELAETDASTLGALDLGAGEGVPTFAALVDWAVESGAAIMADMKTDADDVEQEVARLLAPLPPTQKVVPGASDAARVRFRAIDPTLPLSLSIGPHALTEELFARIIGDPASLCIDAVTFVWPLLARERILALQDAGLFVFAWTVDDAPIVERLAKWGVDGVISNATKMVVERARGYAELSGLGLLDHGGYRVDSDENRSGPGGMLGGERSFRI